MVEAAQESLRRLLPYRNDPARFVLECFHWRPGDGPSPYQLEILRAIPGKRRVSVRGPHGLGKTALAAWLVLWFAITRDRQEGRDWKVVTTASAWRQLSHFLWPEIRKWARQLNWEQVGRKVLNPASELLQQNLKLTRGEAFPVASNEPGLIEGAHADSLLYVFDESKSIPAETFDAAEGALSIGDCYALSISTPGEPQGRFYQIQSRKPGTEDWWVRAVTREECIAAGRMSAEWAEQRRKQWGEGSAVYLNRVEGQFASSDEDGVIPLAWVEAANLRWHEMNDAGEWGPLTRLGCDIARGGSDQNAMARRHGMAIRCIDHPGGRDTMETTGTIVGAMTGNGKVEAVVDLIGIGAGVYDRIAEQKLPVVPFNASERTDRKDASGEMGFVNKRSAAWWNLREMLDPANGHGVALPPDNLLIGDLTAPHWRVMSGGKIQVESKDDLRKPARLGRSTDDGDAVVMAFWEEPSNDLSWYGVY